MASVEKGLNDLSGVLLKPRKFNKGWTEEQEDLMEKWADMAACYRWLHDKCEKHYSRQNMSITVPVIILSTLTGTASVGLNGLVGDDPSAQKYAQIGIGCVSLIAGILTTLGNFFRYAQLMESNRVAGISWGKFQRQIAVELSLHPNDRLDSMDFIKICRAELDRLIEQSPAIPDEIIAAFLIEFKDLPDLKRPDICKGIEHTEAFKDKKTRLKMLASEAAIMLRHKKKLLREEIVPDIDNRLSGIIEEKINSLRNEIEQQVINLQPKQTQQQKQGGFDGIGKGFVPIPITKRGVSSFEPDWKKLLGAPTSQTPLIPKPPSVISESRPSSTLSSQASLTNIVIDIPTSKE